MKNNLRRDELDYILTDTTPVETSELFTYSYFYDYLHQNHKSLKQILDRINLKEITSYKETVPFSGAKSDENNRSWITTPLKFHIKKPDGKSLRKMSIPQPLSVLNMYFFISLYQKDILNLLERPFYSVRYPVRNKDLIYKGRNSESLIEYQYKRDKRSKKAVEQSGRFFDLKPFNQIFELTSSERWRKANLNYKMFAKLDYKRCFDSVYTHSYKWIVAKDVIDSKEFGNSSLFAVIDRILQNINGASSNGVIVGPEFSRMIVEILLQQIDKEVHFELLDKNIIQGIDYDIMRYVDDTFIFCDDEQVQETIIEVFEQKARKYLLEINQLKIEKQVTPYYRADWLDDTGQYVKKITDIIRPNPAIKQNNDEYQILAQPKDILDLKHDFSRLVGKFKDDKATITSYALSVQVNSMSNKSKDYRFFNKDTSRSIYPVLDYTFYVYSHSINFKNTQKLISVLYYIHNEIGLLKSYKLQAILHKYESKIAHTNYNEILNLLIALEELDLHFSLEFEELLLDKITKADDPIALATFLYYSRYDDSFLKSVSDITNKIVAQKINSIQQSNKELLYAEYWYVLIFNKCPYVNNTNSDRIVSILRKMQRNVKGNSDMSIKMIADFMLDPNLNYSFISWHTKGARMIEEITYRTQNKTIFSSNSSEYLASL